MPRRRRPRLLSMAAVVALVLLLLLPLASSGGPESQPQTRAAVESQRLAAAGAEALDVASFHAATPRGAQRASLLRQLYRAGTRRPVLRNGTKPAEVALRHFADHADGSCSESGVTAGDHAADTDPIALTRERLDRLQRYNHPAFATIA